MSAYLILNLVFWLVVGVTLFWHRFFNFGTVPGAIFWLIFCAVQVAWPAWFLVDKF